MVTLLMVTTPLLSMPGQDDGTLGPGPTSATPLPSVESMMVTYEGDPGSPTIYSAMAGLFASGTWYAPAVGGLGHVVSLNYTLNEGKRWDYAVGIVRVPEGRVTLEVRDPSGSTFPDDPVLARSVAAPGGDSVSVDLRTIDPEEHVQLQVAFILDHSGNSGEPPAIKEWVLGESDPDLWHDPFYDVGRDDSRADLVIGEGSCQPIGTHKPGGLLGDYYDNRDFTSHQFQRLDQQIDFDWGNGGPGGGVGRNTFSVRWQGKLMVPEADTYSLYLRVDDGGRLWIDGNQVIDEWRDQSPTEFSASVSMDPGLHDIRIDYYENTGGATCELRWSSSTFSKTLVPHTALWGRKTNNVLVSEDIQLPDGHAWDLLFVESTDGTGPLWYDIFDAHNDVPITGFQCLTAPVLDLSKVSSGLYPRLKLRARWGDAAPGMAPALTMWGVKWMPERTWRSEFLTDIKLSGSVGLQRLDGYIAREGTSTQTSIYAFAESFDGTTDLVDSTVRKGEFWQAGIPTNNATDVAMGDLDGDGLDDVIFTHGSMGMNATGHRATAGGFGTVPAWTLPLPSTSATSSFFTHVETGDLNGDGETDVVLVAYDTATSTNSIVINFNTGSAFNETPDVVVARAGKLVTSISIGDVDNDGMGDIAAGYSTGDNGEAGLYYSRSGWTSLEDLPISSHPILTVHLGDLNGDAFDDLFIGANVTRPSPVVNNNVYYGSNGGINSPPDATFDTAPSFAATFADWDGDSQRDVVFATEDTIWVYLQGTTGYSALPFFSRPGVRDVTTILAGGDDDEDVAFAGAHPSLYDNSGYMEAIGISGVFTRLFHTDEATAVASGSHHKVSEGSLRTAVIDVGDPDQVGGWGWLSYRTPPGQTDFKVTVRLLDAGTEEVLFERTDTRTNPSYNISSVPMDDHPRVYIELVLDNTAQGREARLDHVEINWTDRLPVAPEMVSITADNSTIYRTNSTTLRIQVADERDRPQFLKLTVQMRPPQAGGWISDRLGDPVWRDGNWTVSFTTTRDDPSGVYSFRAWVTDSDMLSSDPMEARDLVTVINNPPGVPGIAILPAEPLTDDQLTCTILRQAYDRDTSYLDYEYRWFLLGVEVPDLNTSTVPRERTEKDQLWRVVVRAFDGEDHGPAVEVMVTIRNSPPKVIRPLGPIELLEDDPPVVMRIAEHLRDPDDDPITIQVTGAGNVSVQVDGDKGTMTVSVPPDWSGRETVMLNVSDGDLVLEAPLEVRVEPVRDPPVVLTIGGRGPVEGRFQLDATQGTESIFLVAVEDVDSSTFRFRSDAALAFFELVTGNGTMIYTPTNGEVGLRSFNLSVEDGEGNSVVVPVDIQVRNVNDPPGPVTIIQPKSAMTFEHDASILMQGTCKDPDEQHGQKLTFIWRSSIDGELDRGMNVQVSGLTPGDHTLTLEVTDGEFSSEKSIKIRVKAPPEEPPNGGPDDPGDGDPFVPSPSEGGLFWVLLALVLIALLAVLVLYRRRSGRVDTTEEEVDDGDIHMVDGIPMAMLGDGVKPERKGETGTDMMSVVLGRSARSKVPDDEIPSSPWSAQDLEISRRPMPTAPPQQPMPQGPPSSAATTFDATEWEEEHTVSPPPPPPPVPQRPPPPPPPPPAAVARAQVPAPPPPGVPSRRVPPKAPSVEEEEWEEVD